MEVVVALIVYLNDPPILKQHLLMSSFKQCLEKRKVITKNSNSNYQCLEVKAVIEHGKILAIRNID